jgi:hypothetical protein
MKASSTWRSASSYATANLNLLLGTPPLGIILQPVTASRALRNLLFAILMWVCPVIA